MRSRLLVGLVLVLTLLGSPAPALAAAGADGALVVAVEGEQAPQGPEPRGPNATDNPAAPDEYQPDFIWAASVLLLVPTALVVVLGGGLYYLAVRRPRQQREGEVREGV